MKTIIAITVSTLTLSAFAAAIPLEINNSAFEQVGKDGYPVGWTKHKDWHGERCGHNGSGGLVFERNAKTPTSGRRPRQQIKLEPGKRYYISALIKTENVTTDRKSSAKGLTILLEGYNAKGKWVFETRARPCVSGTSKGWIKVEGVSRKIPEGITTAYIQPFASGCVSGFGVVDNVHVAALEPIPVIGVFTDAYRNESTGGKVKFFASLDIDTSVHQLEDCSVAFSYVTAGGVTNSIKGDVLSADSAFANIDTAPFAIGTNDVTCTLYAKGKTIGAESIPFARVGTSVPRKVFIDKNRMTYVDGKPFFPLGMFYSSGKICESNMNTYTEAPFNCVMPYGSNLSKKAMDLCHSKGVKVIFDLRMGHDQEDGGKTLVEEKIKMFKDHPALLAWYTNDERPVSAIPKLKIRQGWVEALDRDHPTWSVQDIFYETRNYLGTYDVLGMDPYPVPTKSIKTVISSMRQGTAGTFGIKAIWQVPQAFGWGWLKRRETKGQRGPNKEEMANMTWQSIAGGANGIIYYAFHTLGRASEIPGDNFDLAWARTKAAAFEVKKYEHALVSLEEPPPVSGGTDAVAVRTWRRDGYVYLLAVNCTDKPQRASLELAAETGKGMDVDFGPSPVLEDGKINIDFAPIGYVMLRFRQ